jgi:hypothetical protein
MAAAAMNKRMDMQSHLNTLLRGFPVFRVSHGILMIVSCLELTHWCVVGGLFTTARLAGTHIEKIDGFV